MFKNICILIIVIFSGFCFAQDDAKILPRKTIDAHTAGTLSRGYFDIDFKFFNDGGVSIGTQVGLTKRLNIGISYLVMRLIGNKSIKGQSYPGGLIKYRLMEESYYLPGLAIGFDSQGSGDYYTENSMKGRFYFKSKGIFGVLSKSYLLLGQPLGFHIGCNYSAVDNQATSESKTDYHISNKIVNFSLGLDKSFNEELSILCEYDLALDDNYTRNVLKGYLNAAVRWALIETFVIEIDFKDILGHKRIYDEATDSYKYQNMSRELRIIYINNF